jgi:hypothetical protein
MELYLALCTDGYLVIENNENDAVWTFYDPEEVADCLRLNPCTLDEIFNQRVWAKIYATEETLRLLKTCNGDMPARACDLRSAKY